MRDMRRWLEDLGLAQYVDTFEINGIDDRVLGDLTEDDLKELGVVLGHRKLILKAISAEPDVAGQPDQPGPAAKPVVAPVAMRPREAERRQITVTFCDLVGSTALSERLDPEDLRPLMRAYQQACAKVVERYQGHVAQFLGDGVMIYFGWPSAHEDDAERAVRAGLDIVQAVKSVPAPDLLQVRIGIATGAVVVGATDGDRAGPNLAVGETPNLAARIQSLAAEDEILISPSTRRLIAGVFELDDLGTHAMKGIVEPVNVWRVVRLADTEGRFEAHLGRMTPLVGREEEVGLLLRRWSLARAGEGQVALLCGEPGIGKSRITEALIGHVDEEPHIRLRYQCSPYYINSAFHPLIEQIERAAGFDRADTPDRKLERLEALLSQGTNDLETQIPYFAALLAIEQTRYARPAGSPQKVKEQTFDALARQLFGLSRVRPVLMIVEDAHWIDQTTLEALGAFIDGIQGHRVLLIVTYRPEFEPPWSGYGHITTHTLNRLSRRQGAALVTKVARSKALPDEVMEQIVAKTDGVPLFVEELTKMVIEAGYLDDVGTEYRLSGALPALAIPSTLRDSLMARLDRLAPVKEIAQIGACVGRDFTHELVAALSPLDEEALQDGLNQLMDAELIFRRGTGPSASYTFKHALVHEAAAESLLKENRRRLHERIALTLEERYPEMRDTSPEVLAHHFQAAEIHSRAAENWLLAGKRAVSRAAYREATGQLAKALDCLSHEPDDESRRELEVEIYTVMGPAIVASESWASPAARQLYEKAQVACRELGDPARQFVASWGVWLFRQTGLGSKHSRPLAEEMLNASEQEGSVELRLQAHHAAWTTYVWGGDPRTGDDHARRGIALYDPREHGDHASRYGGHDPCVCGYGQGAIAQWLLGSPDQAVGDIERAIALGKQLNHPPSIAHGLVWGSWVHQFRREHEATKARADEAFTLASSQGLGGYIAMALVARGWARAMEGDGAVGLKEIDDGLKMFRAAGMQMSVSYFLALHAEALIKAGQFEAALEKIVEARASIPESGEHFWEADLVRLAGEIALLETNKAEDEAAARFVEAIEIARRQGARALELRAATSLGRLLHGQGKSDEARALVAPVFDAFTEGHRTADLIAAETLLAKLA